MEDDFAYRDIPRRGLSSYLDKVKVGSCQPFDAADLVSVHDPGLLAALDGHARIRGILYAERDRLGPKPHLDEAKIRLDDAGFGRPLTQACARLVHDSEPAPAGMHYQSKHDDTEDCWAVFDRARVTFTHTVTLSPEVDEHCSAVREVAELWNLALPEAWADCQTSLPTTTLDRRRSDSRRTDNERRKETVIDLTEDPSSVSRRNGPADRRRGSRDRRH